MNHHDIDIFTTGAASMFLPLLVDQGNKKSYRPAQTCTSKNCKAAEHIIALTRSLMEACNAQNYSTLESLGAEHVSPNFRAKFESGATNSWEAYLAAQRYWSEKHPEWENRIVNVSAEVNENHANGTVYLLVEVLGWEAGSSLRRTVCTVTKWKKREGKWIAYESSAMRGLDPMLVAAEEGEEEENEDKGPKERGQG